MICNFPVTNYFLSEECCPYKAHMMLNRETSFFEAYLALKNLVYQTLPINQNLILNYYSELQAQICFVREGFGSII